MGIDAGFDIHPPLVTEDDRKTWSRFLIAVMEEFEGDSNVVLKPDRITVELGEHPTLDFSIARFRRFSSKVSTTSGTLAEHYIKHVFRISQRFFGPRVHWWDTDLDFSTLIYEWNEVHEAQKHPTPKADLFLGWPDKPSFVPFEEICQCVQAAFEKVNVGMDGLRFHSASFPTHGNYHITNKSSGSILNRVRSIEDWANKNQVSKEDTVKAYWANRCANNCETLNRTLEKALLLSRKEFVVCALNGSKNQYEAIEIQSLELKQIGLTPHIQGTIVEPPLTSFVPRSPDGETFHVFITGMTRQKKIVALDCSCAQFGVFSKADKQPFIALDLRSYLKTVGKHRILCKHEKSPVSVVNPFVQQKVNSCLGIMS